MATERNVVDFKIHNLTEEQFQELKAQGKIDPNAVYCTPDTTKERLDTLENAVTGLNSSISSVDSSAVHKTGDETISGNKTFADYVIKKIAVDSTTAPSAYVETALIESQDKNNKLMSSLRSGRTVDGGSQTILYSRKNNADGTNTTANLKVGVDGSGNVYAQAPTPAASDNSTKIATTAWANAKFLPLSGGQISGDLDMTGRQINVTATNGFRINGSFAPSMPSEKYTTLSLGASGNTYTAPADGYFALRKAATGAQYVTISNDTTGLSITHLLTSGSSDSIYLPVKSGDVVKISYTLGGTTTWLRFYYAVGAKHLAA